MALGERGRDQKLVVVFAALAIGVSLARTDGGAQIQERDDKANAIVETPCHEGNYALTGILAGVRALEKEKGRNRRVAKAYSKA